MMSKIVIRRCPFIKYFITTNTMIQPWVLYRLFNFKHEIMTDHIHVFGVSGATNKYFYFFYDNQMMTFHDNRKSFCKPV